MNIVHNTVRVVAGAGDAATATLGAIGGAAIGSVVGTVKGAGEGAVEGARRGSHSTPAAVMTMGAVALTGVVEWPLVAAAGGTALLLHQLKPDQGKTEAPAEPGTAGTTTPESPKTATEASAAGGAARTATSRRQRSALPASH
jgi:hypothetical protein